MNKSRFQYWIWQLSSIEHSATDFVSWLNKFAWVMITLCGPKNMNDTTVIQISNSSLEKLVINNHWFVIN